MADTVYVVSGTTGEYSDQREWYVRAFLSQEKAQALAVELKRVYKEAEALAPQEDMWDWRNKWKHPLDPAFKCDYTGTDYGVFEVPLDTSHD